MAGLAQIIGRGQACGAGAHQDHFFAGLLLGSPVVPLRMGEHVVAHAALHCVDRQAVVAFTRRFRSRQVPTVTMILAGMGAHPAGDGAQGVIADQHIAGALHVVVAQKLHIAADIRPHGTGRGTAGGLRLHTAEDRVIAVVAADGIAFLAALPGTI